MTKKIFFILTIITLFGFVLRFYKLGNVELGFFRDEAALGFNTWSILKTGADEYGQKFPLVFRSFEVFFMPAYVYLSVPFFAIFGLTEFSARALSALSGVSLIVASFFLGRRLFKSEKVGLIVASLVSILPWSLFYSRGAFEGNLALLFFAIGAYFWLSFWGTRKRSHFFLSLFLFICSMYSYQAPRFVVPIFVGISILVQKQWYKNIKLWIAGAVFCVLLYLPIVLLTTSAAGYHRAFGVSIFSSGHPVSINELSSLYLHYFSPTNLFWNGDYNLQRNIPGYSVFYWWLLPFMLLGLVRLFKSKLKEKKYIYLWLLLAPIPAALTRDPFHTYRSILFYLPLTLIIGYGIFSAVEMLKSVSKKLFYVSIGSVALISLAAFMFAYFKVAPVIMWSEWDYGYGEISSVLKNQPDNLKILTDDDFTEAYIHYLYYGLISLSDYQRYFSNMSADTYYASTDIVRPAAFNRFEFRKVDWPSERGNENTIFVFPAKRLPPSEFSTDPKLTLIYTVYAPNGEPAFYIIRR